MDLCIFEDKGVLWLEPLTLTRAAFELRCGATSLLERQLRAFGVDEAAAVVRPEVAALCQGNHPRLAVSTGTSLNGQAILVNARWLAPAEPLGDLTTPRVGLVDNQVAYIVLPADLKPDVRPDTIDDQLEGWRQELPACAAGGALINFAWDLIEHNGPTLCADATWFQRNARAGRAEAGSVIGPAERLLLADGATIEPMVVVDTRRGPVMLDRGAVVQSFTRIEGPCYVGPESWVVGGKICGSSLGPCCRVGGEVQETILQGFSNKYHDGFLGHSYLGEWVNVAAGTQVSDLRNDYRPIKVTVGGERIPTGRTKV